jgi:alpha-2-macroglobulin
VEWGEYELVVAGGGAASAARFAAGWFAAADTARTPDTLDLSLDKPAYKPGETARLRIVPRAAGTALVTVLSNRLVAMQAVEVGAGENLIDLPVTDEWGAGVYVTASVIRPMDVAAGRNPARALGLAHAVSTPAPASLQATIETAAEAARAAPWMWRSRSMAWPPGDTGLVTLAAVDVGILNLTRFAAPDPSAHYFGQRKLGVGIRDIYGRLIDGLNGAEGASGPAATRPAGLASGRPADRGTGGLFHRPDEVGADGYARARFDLPSFNGTVRVMAVAWSERESGRRRPMCWCATRSWSRPACRGSCTRG